MFKVYDCLADCLILDTENETEATRVQNDKGGENNCIYLFTSVKKYDTIRESVPYGALF